MISSLVELGGELHNILLESPCFLSNTYPSQNRSDVEMVGQVLQNSYASTIRAPSLVAPRRPHRNRTTMGNAQSSDGHHNRLSKPKTNTNSPKVDSPALASSRYADWSAKDRHHLKAQLFPHPETDFCCGLSSDEDNSIGDLASQVQVHLNLSRSSSLVSRSRIGSKRMSASRVGSFRESRPSLVPDSSMDPQHVDIDTAVKILQQVRRTASPGDLAALQQALQPDPSTSLAPAPEQGLSRRTSVINRSSSSLTRRRSLAETPGLATRNSLSDTGRKTWNSWKTPQLDPQEQQKWNKKMMGSSPLTRIASLGPAEGSDLSTPRAQTPGDMDYSHLGSLKPGSLVVTNGAPSPAPSAKDPSKRKSTTYVSQGEDYFGGSEGNTSPTVRNGRKGLSRSKSAISPQPPSRTHEASNSATDMSWVMPVTIKTKKSSRPIPKRLQLVNKSAETLAQAYIAEMPLSPYRNAHITDHDEEFSEPVDSLDDNTSSREEAFNIINGITFNEPVSHKREDGQYLKASPAAVEAVEATRTYHRRRDSRPSPRKADSGYSSGGSFRTTGQHKADVNRSWTPRTPSQTETSGVSSAEEATMTSPTLLHASAETPNFSMALPSPSTTLRSTADSATFTNKRLQKRQPSIPDLPVVQTCHPITTGTIPSVPDNVRAKFVRRLSEAPEMECLTKTVMLSKDSTTSDEAIVSSLRYSFDVSSPASSRASSPAPQKRHHTRSQTERPGVRHSLSFFRRKTAAKESDAKHSQTEESPAVNLTDLGTVGSTLGSSPYDIAMANVSKKAVTSPTHPHQLGNAFPRAKSMASMDAETAVTFARNRSKDIALSPPEMPQRVRSYHNPDAGEATVARRRSRAIYADADAPPVPVVDSKRMLLMQPSDKLEQSAASEEGQSGHRLQARSADAISQPVERYDENKAQPASVQPDWESHARLWSQRRKSIGEGLKARAEAEQRENTYPTFSSTYALDSHSAIPRPPVMDRYSGGFAYGYEHGYGIGGSAGTRQPKSAASRKSLKFSKQYGVDLSDVPIFLQKI
jgi:hypothetical protein